MSAGQEHRVPGTMADSPAVHRFSGVVDVDATLSHVLQLAQQEAADNGSDVGAGILLVSLLREVESVGAATAGWLGMTVGRVRAAAGLRSQRRVVAGGAPSGGPPRRPGSGPLVLCGGAPETDLLRQVTELASRRSDPAVLSAVAVDLGWASQRPTARQRRWYVDQLAEAGARCVSDSGLTDREDAFSSEICQRLATADLIWFAGGDTAAVYDRLWATPALAAIRTANNNGAVVGGVSAGAAVWGAGTLSTFVAGVSEPFPLFGWLADLVVFAHYVPVREPTFRKYVAAFPGCQGLAIGHGGAVVVGPDNRDLAVLAGGADGARSVQLAGPEEALRAV